MKSNQHQPEPEKQPTEQQPEQKPQTYTMQTKHGEYELRIIGDPARLLDIPIKFYYGIDVSPKNNLRPPYQPVQDEPLPATAKTSKPSRSHHVAADNADLRAENEQLRAKIEALKNALNAQHD